MNNKNHAYHLPIPIQRVLRELGSDLKNARRRRRISTLVMAKRAGIARTTLYKIEKGDPSVSIVHYASVLFVLGLLDRLRHVADIVNDEVGLALDEEDLPQRIHYKKSRKPSE